MNRSYRKSRWQVSRMVLRNVQVLFLLLSVLLFFQWKELRHQVQSLKEQLHAYERVVYVAGEKLPKGTVLSYENAVRQTRYSDCEQWQFITENDFGMAVNRDIAKGSCLTTDMLSFSEGNVREFFLSDVVIPEHVEAGDRIDLRIRYQNAEEYIILANKPVLSCESGRGMVVNLTEEEILLVSSAIADREQYDKTKLYVVEYPEYEQIEESKVTYIANREVLMLLGKEKMEGESRNALEERMMQKE